MQTNNPSAQLTADIIQRKINSTSRKIDYYFQGCALRGRKKLRNKHGTLEKIRVLSRCNTCLKYLSSRDHTNYETAYAEFTEACMEYMQRTGKLAESGRMPEGKYNDRAKELMRLRVRVEQMAEGMAECELWLERPAKKQRVV